MSEELPKGWIKTTLGEIAKPSRERALPSEIPDTRYIGLEHIESHTMRLVEHGYARDARSSSVRFSKGDILYCKMRPYLNKVWVAEFDGLCSAEFLVFPQSEGMNNQFLALRLNAVDFVTFANSQVNGERPRVDFEKLSNFSVLLPPISEQERIVTRLNAALSGLERAQKAALRAHERLNDYRAAVLHSAVTGELTREWREAQQDIRKSNPDTGRALLQRLLAFRRAHWEETELKRLRAAGNELKGDKWKTRYPEPIPPRMEGLPQLPESWTWASLDQIGELARGKSKHRPRGDSRLYGGPYPFIQTGDIRKSGGTIREHTQTYSEFGLIQSRLWPNGTLCITIAANIAETGILSYPACFPDSVVGFVQNDTLLKVRFLEFFIRSEKSELERYAPSTAQKNINLELLRGLAVPLPPYAEQFEIVFEVERRLSAAERLTATLDLQADHARNARQSLLRDAFVGNLVPQDPHDEPASVLLERIRSEITQTMCERKDARRGFRLTEKKRSDSMRLEPPSPESLSVVWERIGQKTDARRLYNEAGFGPDEVAQFYEILRATPEVRVAFQEAAQKQRQPHESAKPFSQEHTEGKGHFRLVELWLENFKNLKDYTIRFDPTHGLDVVLGWNGTGKSNLFESLVIIFRDLHDWWEKNRWPDKPMNGYRLSYEIDECTVVVTWQPGPMKRPELKKGPIARKAKEEIGFEIIKREKLPLPRFIFGYYSGPTNRLAEHFLPMKQAHYERLRKAKTDDPKTMAELLEQRRFFCAETHHAKYVLLAFSYKEDQKITEFLKTRLRILAFESALFVIRKPRWAVPGSKAEDFWGAKGIMRRVMERLRSYAIAPMVLKQSVSYGHRTTTEDHYYFFLPDIETLHSFAADYKDARTFFLALESTDFSELIHDVKIQVRIKANNTEQISITFHQLSEGEQQLLMVLGLMRFTKSHQSLVLLDEPDTHLNPHWSVDYLKDLRQVMGDGAFESPEQQSSQILMATHDPLVIASLVKEQIHLLKRDLESLKCYWEQPSDDPRGLGFTGILTSDMFGFRSDLDPETMELLDSQVNLAGKENLNPDEAEALIRITNRVEQLGFKSASSDPYYRAFIKAVVRRQEVLRRLQKTNLTNLDFEALERETDEIIREIEDEEAKSK